jgi:osmotically-inducible protein OsmY
MTMKMRTDALAIAAVASMVLGTAGCTNPNSTATGEGTAERMGKAVDAGAQEVKEDTKEAGQAVAEGAEQAGEAVSGAAENVGEAVGGAVENAGEAVKGAAAVTTLTPKVKSALIASKQIDGSTLDVDTDDEKKTVIIKGTLPTQAKKDLATQIGKKALADAKSDYKLQNDVTVSP